MFRQLIWHFFTPSDFEFPQKSGWNDLAKHLKQCNHPLQRPFQVSMLEVFCTAPSTRTSFCTTSIAPAVTVRGVKQQQAIRACTAAHPPELRSEEKLGWGVTFLLSAQHVLPHSLNTCRIAIILLKSSRPPGSWGQSGRPNLRPSEGSKLPSPSS